MVTINDLRTAVENKSAQVLTIDLANELKGRKIATLYFGYKGQDGFDEFVIGEVKPEIYGNGTKGRICVFTAEGRNTYIRAHKENHGAFTCSDSDRFVYFIEVPENTTQKICGVTVKINENDFCPGHMKQEFKTIEEAVQYMKRKDVVYKPIRMGEKMLTLQIEHTDDAIENWYENSMSLGGSKLPTHMWK